MYNQYISLSIPCTTNTLVSLYHVQLVHWVSYTLALAFTLVDERDMVKEDIRSEFLHNQRIDLSIPCTTNTLVSLYHVQLVH